MDNGQGAAVIGLLIMAGGATYWATRDIRKAALATISLPVLSRLGML